MPQATNYDAIVIGSSRGGRLLPIAFAKAGRKVALVEREHVGGTCINVGCTPTKTMVASARVAYLTRRGVDYGVHTGPISVDMQAIRKRKQGIVDGAASALESRIEATQGLDLLRGLAHFIAPKTLEVYFKGGETREITAPMIFIDTGDRPEQLAIKGVQSVSVLNSTTIIQRRPCLLTREDEDVSDEIAKILREDGITVLTGTTPQQVEQQSSGRMQLTVRTPQGEQQLTGSHLLAAAGRVPNTEDLTLEAAGVHLDKQGYIQVNGQLETNVPGIYALGDVKGGPAYTHIASDDFRILRTNLLEHGSASTQDRLVSYTIFIDPQLGRVGMSENEARKQGHNIRVAKLPMNSVPRALETGETRGFMKAIVDADTQQILGCAILGLEGGEIMTIIQVAMMGKLPYTALKEGMFAHPTLAEGLNFLFMMLDS